MEVFIASPFPREIWYHIATALWIDVNNPLGTSAHVDAGPYAVIAQLAKGLQFPNMKVVLRRLHYSKALTSCCLPNGSYHREDGPALIWADGTLVWRQNSHLHRRFGPAIVRGNGIQEWYQNDQRHRDGGPAITRPLIIKRSPGSTYVYEPHGRALEEWYQRGELHREDAPAITYADGTLKYYLLGLLHRDNGPAVMYPDGSEEWYRRGLLHRFNGPAVTAANGTTQRYQNGKPLR